MHRKEERLGTRRPMRRLILTKKRKKGGQYRAQWWGHKEVEAISLGKRFSVTAKEDKVVKDASIVWA